jgi:hypothetical protein
MFQFTSAFQLYYDPRVDSASNRNEYKEIFWEGGDKALPALKADNLTAISEPIDMKM